MICVLSYMSQISDWRWTLEGRNM